jgi:hypothetical protein
VGAQGLSRRNGHVVEAGQALISGAVLEAPGLVAGLDDVAVVGEAVEERGRHLGVAEDGGPFAEVEVGGDDDRGALVESADEVEEELPAGLREGQVSEFIEDDKVEAREVVGQATLLAAARLGLEPVHHVDDVEQAPAGAAPDERPGDGDCEVGLPRAGPADEDDVCAGRRRSRRLRDRGPGLRCSRSRRSRTRRCPSPGAA